MNAYEMIKKIEQDIPEIQEIKNERVRAKFALSIAIVLENLQRRRF